MSAATLVEPRYRTAPDFYETEGPAVADLCHQVGFGPDPEQAAVLDDLFAVDRYGMSIALETCVVACRQNLKTGLFKQAALGWLFLLDQRLIVWSAHEFPTAAEAFRDMDVLITNSDMLRKRVKAIHRGNGDEAIELLDDRRLIFKARTKGGGVGLTGDKIILDEAWALQPNHMGALLPTLSARPDPQVVYGSSAGRSESGVLRGIRDRGRKGKEPSLIYYEWCAPNPAEICAKGEQCTHALDAEGCGCDDPENWRPGNPAMGRRITQRYIGNERRALPPAEFGRERMGWWDEPLGDIIPIPLSLFKQRAALDMELADPIAIAFDVTPERDWSSIAAAGRTAEGLSGVDLIEHRQGTGWLLKRLEELDASQRPCVLVYDPSSPAGALEKALIERGWEIEKDPDTPVTKRLHPISTRELAQTFGDLVDAVKNDEFRYCPAPPLTDAVEGLRTRPLGESIAPSRKNSDVDISPIVAAMLARHGFATYGVVAPPAPIGFWGR